MQKPLFISEEHQIVRHEVYSAIVTIGREIRSEVASKRLLAKHTRNKSAGIRAASGKTRDDAKQAHCAMKLTHHWRGYQRQQRNELLNRMLGIGVKDNKKTAS